MQNFPQFYSDEMFMNHDIIVLIQWKNLYWKQIDNHIILDEFFDDASMKFQWLHFRCYVSMDPNQCFKIVPILYGEAGGIVNFFHECPVSHEWRAITSERILDSL